MEHSFIRGIWPELIAMEALCADLRRGATKLRSFRRGFWTTASGPAGWTPRGDRGTLLASRGRGSIARVGRAGHVEARR